MGQLRTSSRRPKSLTDFPPIDFAAPSHLGRSGYERMKTITIGIMPQARIRARMLAIAKGEYKPKPGEPKI